MKKQLIYIVSLLPLVLLGQITPGKNSILTNTYTDSTGGILSVIQYFDGLGRPVQSIAVGEGVMSYGLANLLPAGELDALGGGATETFNLYGRMNESSREMGNDPYGRYLVLWKAGPGVDELDGPGDNDSDGGWITDYLPIDNTYGYRYVNWVKRTGPSLQGTVYHGTQNASNVDGNANPYSYFWTGDPPNQDEWYLMVGVIYPHDYIGPDTGVSGLYDRSGNKVLDGNDLHWDNTAENTRLKAFYAYSDEPLDNRYFFAPVFERLDGTEQSLESYFQNSHSSDHADVVMHYEYDALGRQTREYLPYPAITQGSGIHTDPLTDQTAYYQTNHGTGYGYSESVLEASPLSRVLEQGAPGDSWAVDPFSDNDRTIKFEYGTNATDEVVLFEVELNVEDLNGVVTYRPALITSGSYPTATLAKMVTKDENWQPGDGGDHTSEEFTNKKGQVVLKRIYSNGEAHDTYYVHDDYGNLTYVLPPAINTANPITPELLASWSYQYVYDHRNRMVEKKLPGREWESIVYNKLDQPILTQDPNLEVEGKWLFTKYDRFGRTTYSGIYNSSGDRLQQQEQVNSEVLLYETKSEAATAIDGEQVYYSNDAFPNVNLELHNISYYDEYPSEAAQSAEVYGVTPTDNTKGLPTYSKVRILGTNHYISSTLYYDEKGRAISTVTENPFQGTTDWVDNELDFVGNVLRSEATHEKDGESTTMERTFNYDERNRLVSTLLSVNGGPEEELFHNTYDELGQLTSKGLHAEGLATYSEQIDYTYNVRGWLTGIDDTKDYFSMQLSHDDGPSPLYNGNIGQWSWETDGKGPQVYDYTYDALNRITSGVKNGGTHSLSSVVYDKMGNILNLTRTGDTGTNMDELTYSYLSGNQLGHVTDNSADTLGFHDRNTTGDDYVYDANGNMVKDLNKRIDTIYYNHLNLPTTIILSDSEGSQDSITYLYNAAGIKLRKEVREDGQTTTTDYLDPFIYENDQLQLIQHEEGRIVPISLSEGGQGEGFDYQYHLKDHLGNVRVTFSTTPENYEMDATMEDANEQTMFSNYVATPDGAVANSGTHVSRNSNTVNGGLGMNTFLGVNKGDTIKASAYAYYSDAGGSYNLAAGLIEGALFGSFGTNYSVEGATVTQTNFDNAFASGTALGDRSNSSSAPLAYINYLVFDKEMNFVTASFTQITSASNGAMAQVTATDYIVDREGYVMVYLSNETQGSELVVSWDDLEVYQGKTDVVQTDEYYPFGLTYNSTQRTASRLNTFNTFQDQEIDKTTNWLQFKWRNHQPEIGRFFNIDPLSEKYVYNSTYAFSENVVINAVELEGLEKVEIHDNSYLFNEPRYLLPIEEPIESNQNNEKPPLDYTYNPEGMMGLSRPGDITNTHVRRTVFSRFIKNAFSAAWEALTTPIRIIDQERYGDNYWDQPGLPLPYAPRIGSVSRLSRVASAGLKGNKNYKYYRGIVGGRALKMESYDDWAEGTIVYQNKEIIEIEGLFRDSGDLLEFTYVSFYGQNRKEVELGYSQMRQTLENLKNWAKSLDFKKIRIHYQRNGEGSTSANPNNVFDEIIDVND